jgi:hypothetical protein
MSTLEKQDTALGPNVGIGLSKKGILMIMALPTIKLTL